MEGQATLVRMAGLACSGAARRREHGGDLVREDSRAPDFLLPVEGLGPTLNFSRFVF
jgi:hypothetical protein